ncbi:hypothetical protein PIB30_026623 [Stylosanthes scabra]|uniref:Glycosyltransferase n=1 Tax=Stylosanthes scabra TaxID=79078 RepID=A0ABU6XC50_9FABA|nr:hypothetical protein [Stylosanthes scabra]
MINLRKSKKKKNDKASFDESSKVSLQHYEKKTFSEDHTEEKESGVSDIFRLQQVLGGVDGLAVRSCMEIEAESIKSFQNEYSKPVIPVGIIPPSAQLFSEIAMGLELSGFPFFWVLKKQNISPDISSSIDSVIESLQFGCPLVMLPFQNDQGLVARLMKERMVGVKVARNEHDGKFSRDSLAKALRSVMLEDEGKSCRSHAEKMSKVVGDKELYQKYIDEFVEYMEIHRSA